MIGPIILLVGQTNIIKAKKNKKGGDSMLKLIIGICLVIFSVVSTIVCIGRTPDNLRGFYGAMFVAIAFGSLVGGISLILSYFGLV